MKNGTFGRIVIFLALTALFCSVYIYCLRRQTKPNIELATSEIATEKAESTVAETTTIAAALKKWFLSDWGQALSGGNGQLIINRIEKEFNENKEGKENEHRIKKTNRKYLKP